MILSDIAGRLKNSTSKDHICREAKTLFHDKNFTFKENENDYLICFKNGVYDLLNGIFRDGYPEDYITKCTMSEYRTVSLARVFFLIKLLISEFIILLKMKRDQN